MKESYCDISSPLNSLFSEEVNLVQSQYLDFLTTICGTKPNHGMKAKGEGMGKELSIGYEDTSIRLSLSGSCPCAYLDKQLLDSVDRIEPSYHDLELLQDCLFFDLLVANFSSSCASKWSKIHIFLESFVESGYDESISRFSWSLSDVFHAKLKGEFVEDYDYETSFLCTFMKTLDGFIPSIQLLCFVIDQFEFPHDEQKVLGRGVGFLYKYLLMPPHGHFFPKVLAIKLGKSSSSHYWKDQSPLGRTNDRYMSKTIAFKAPC
ncbi:hypothetical protein M9H77_02266 [Catharanthus roseus]|uniref:Uncharacterized protein n=1 Tax=Catharanthus roseus TaxID=4058 RepID=A0ACC0C822_CATRO|nr:hypothetical protein M9H77_02266 [Catharanthus roseus]